MWKIYSFGYLKKNRASCITIMAAALISTIFLSFICCLFYNTWQYDIAQIIYEEGDWHGRLAGQLTQEDEVRLTEVESVQSAVLCENYDGTIYIDIKFHNMRDSYELLEQAAKTAGIENAETSYNVRLLSQYFIFDPLDEQPPMLLGYYVFVLLVTAFSLILMLRGAFDASMSARVHQLGIISSIGATPRQILTCLLQEAFALCSLPILLGSLGGIGAGMIFMGFAKTLGSAYRVIPVTFEYHPLVWLITIMTAALTILVSAWIPAFRLSRVSPLQAIHSLPESMCRKRKSTRILKLLFGELGVLAGNSMKARKKELRMSAISLTLSFLAFSMFLIFATLSDISTRHTYFERYRDSWDVMITLSNVNMDQVTQLPEIAAREDVEDCVAYDIVTVNAVLSTDELDTALQNATMLSSLENRGVGKLSEDMLKVTVPVVVMDDAGFLHSFPTVTGVDTGAVLYNSVWDSVNSNFRYPLYNSFINESVTQLSLSDEAGNLLGLQISLTDRCDVTPPLREDYKDYAMVLFVSNSYFKSVQDITGVKTEDTVVRVLATDDIYVDAIADAVRDGISGAFGGEVENRVREEQENVEMWRGYKIIVGAICALLALIGVVNIFTHTIGFLVQRKREFARYLSVGVTPGEIRKMFAIEVLVLAGRPILFTIPPAVLFAWFAIFASYLDPMEFLPEIPYGPIAIFILVILACVSLAYAIGGNRLLKCDLNEALRNEGMI